MTEQLIQCPHCQGQLSIGEELFNIELQCPLCQKIFVYPPAPQVQQMPQMQGQFIPPQMQPGMPPQGGFRPGVPPMPPQMQQMQRPGFPPQMQQMQRPGFPPQMQQMQRPGFPPQMQQMQRPGFPPQMQPGMPPQGGFRPGVPPMPPQMQPMSDPPQKSRKKGWIIAGACIAFLLVLGIILPFAISSYNRQQELKAAKELGITFSEDNKTLLTCPENVTSVVIPSGVTTIGDEAFEGCKKLSAVTIPDSVTAIGMKAFCGCKKLTEVTIPDSVKSIGDGAFYGCKGLTAVSIGNGVRSIGESAFEHCESLTDITIPDGVTAIGESAFEDCIKLTAITISGSVTAIGNRAFHNCGKLTEVTIPDSVIAAIGKEAFKNSGLDLKAKAATTGCITRLKEFGMVLWSYYEDGNKALFPADIDLEKFGYTPKHFENIIYTGKNLNLHKIQYPGGYPVAICNRRNHESDLAHILFADGHVGEQKVDKDADTKDIIRQSAANLRPEEIEILQKQLEK